MALGTGWTAACPLGVYIPGVEMLGPVKWHTVGAQDTWEVSLQTQLACRCSEALPECWVGSKSGLAADTCLMCPECGGGNGTC